MFCFQSEGGLKCLRTGEGLNNFRTGWFTDLGVIFAGGSVLHYMPWFFPSGLLLYRTDKVYDVISCLNKNLTHFVWHLEKKKSYGIETLSIDRVLN